MAKRISLREYQEGMIVRLQGATSASQEDARLGFELAGERWLLDLADIAEVLPLPTVAPVPLAQSWFRGVANIRGNLVSVVDLQAFFGGNALMPTSFSRLLLLHPRRLNRLPLFRHPLPRLKPRVQLRSRTTLHQPLNRVA